MCKWIFPKRETPEAVILTRAMKPSVSIVGAGRVGRTLGRMLYERGWHIAAVVTRSSKTARAAVRMIGSGTPCYEITPHILIGTKNPETATRQGLNSEALCRR
jgi:predicted dinucleotide-binding enzyme